VPERKNRRAAAAEETRDAIVEAAQALFVERGYQATTIADIARQAGVAVQTVYNAVGAKREVLSRVLDVAAAGERAPRRVPEFMTELAEAEPDAGRVVDLLVDFWTDALPRTAPTFRVIREAAAVDAEAATLERTRAAGRLANYGHAGRLMAERGVLRPGIEPDDAAAAIFAIGHPEAFRTLVLEGDWTVARWAEWARAALRAALLA
jgi:AcrR family transcriptional regulator